MSYYKQTNVKIAILIVVLISSYVYSFFGLDWTDTFYYLNLIRHGTIGENAMISGTLLLGKLLFAIIGDHYLILWKTIDWLLLMASLFIPYFMLLDKEERLSSIYLIIFAIPCLTDRFLFDPRELTFFFSSICLTCFIKYIITRNFVYLSVCSFLLALLVFVRFPNILFFPLFLFALVGVRYLYKNQFCGHRYVLHLFIFFFLTLCFFIGFCTITNNGILPYIDAVRESMTSVDNGHSLKSLIIGDLYQIRTVVFYAALLIVFLIGFIFLKKHKYISKPISLILGVLLYIIFFTIVVKGHHDALNFSYNFRMLLIGFIVFIMFLVSYKEPVKKNLALLLFILSCSAVPAMGSDTRLFSMLPILAYFLPFIYIRYNVSNYVECKSFIVVLALLLFVSTIYRNSWATSLDGSLFKVNTELSAIDKRLSFIHSTKGRANDLSDMLGIYKKISKKNNVIFWGARSKILIYLTDAKDLNMKDFWSEISHESAYNEYQEYVLRNRPYVIYVNNGYAKTSDALNGFMYKQGYRISCYKSYRLFKP